jgi:hypothetical protein
MAPVREAVGELYSVSLPVKHRKVLLKHHAMSSRQKTDPEALWQTGLTLWYGQQGSC